ncbi:Peroxisomal membrane protein 13 [Linum perenne]
MAANSQPTGGGAPPKPWERAGTSSSGPAPFKPPSDGSTSAVVEASGTAQPGEIVPAGSNNTNMNALSRPVPNRPWQPQTNQYGGGYGSTSTYGYGGMGTMGGMGGMGGYSSGLYGNSMYRGGYGGGGLYGGGMNTGSYGGLYGGGMNTGAYGGYGGYGNTMGGGYGMGGYGPPNPDDVPTPPSVWISFLRAMGGIVQFFGRVAMLIDQNTQSFHMFMTALLQFFDHSGMLYGELARFVLRVLGVKTKPKKLEGPAPGGHPSPHNPHGYQNQIQAPKAAGGAGWDNVWGNDGNSS